MPLKKNRTYQPRNPFERDRFFVLPRTIIFAGVAAWLAATAGQMEFLLGERTRLIASVLPLLLWFACYTGGFLLLSRFYQRRKRALYQISIALDVVFITMLVRATGACMSNFYIAYYPIIALEVFYFGALGGAVITLASAGAYTALYMGNPDQLFVGDLALRLGFMCLVYIVLATLEENEKRARENLQKQKHHIDVLNTRLEQSYQELVEDRESLSLAVTEKERLLNEQNIAAARRRSSTTFARELNAQSDIPKTVALFSRYVRSLLEIERADIVILKNEAGAATYFPSDPDEEIQEIPINHSLIRKAFADSDDEGYFELTWNYDQSHEIPDSLLIGPSQPSALHIETLTGGRMGTTGILILTSDRNYTFDPDLLDEVKILGSHLTVAVENIFLRDKLQQMADTDGLTGVFNHRFFQQRLDEEIMRSKRYERPVSLIMMDIDYFKKLNDTMGHQTGDAVLRELGMVVKNQLRNLDVLCRYGGEEFVIILPETDGSGGLSTAERIRRAISKHSFRDTAGKAFGITVSLGVSSMPPLTEKQQLIKSADDALYRAKESGRNCVAS